MRKHARAAPAEATRPPPVSMPPEADGAQAARLLRLPTRHPSAVTVVGGPSFETLCTDRRYHPTFRADVKLSQNPKRFGL